MSNPPKFVTEPEERRAVNAATSNAGDDFHILWAVRKSLMLLKPGTQLSAIKTEGIPSQDASQVDPSGHSLLSIDLSEYYMGETFVDASRVVFSQLKYSTTNPTALWTLAEIVRGKKANSHAGSLIHGLAKVFKSHLNAYGRDKVLSKLKLCLVSNRPTDSKLEQAIGSAQDSLKPLGSTKAADLIKTLNKENGSVVKKLKEASLGLQSSEFCDFLRILDVSSYTDELSRTRQEISLAEEIGEFGFQDTRTQRYQLKSKIWDLSQPGQDRIITRNDVFAMLGSSYDASFPSPNKVITPETLIERPQSKSLANEITGSQISTIVLHGEGGCGKTTLLSTIGKHLPRKSVCVVFDGFASGAYKNPTDCRHRHEYGLTQIQNEIATATGTSLLLNQQLNQGNRLRQFYKKLEEAIAVIRCWNEEAIVCICIDAADNSLAAAKSLGEKAFVEDLLKEPMPDGCKLVLSCRTHRLEDLHINDSLTCKVRIEPFNLDETTTKILTYYDETTTELCEEFHRLTEGNPRVQDYFLLPKKDHFEEVLDFLRPNGKSLDGLFKEALKEASLKNSSEELVAEVCRSLVNLPRPVPIRYIALTSNCEEDAATDVLRDLTKGVIISKGLASFRDENLDNYLAEHYPATSEFHRNVADILLKNAATCEYAAVNIGQALAVAGRTSEIAGLVDDELGIEQISDPIKRRNIQASRIWTALHNAESDLPNAKTIQLLCALAGESKSSDATDRMLQAYPSIALRYGSTETFQHLCRFDGWGEPGRDAVSHMYSAGILSRIASQHPDAKQHQRCAEESLQAWLKKKQSEDSTDLNLDNIDNSYFAMLVESYLRTDGLEAAIEWIERWSPIGFIVDVLQRVAESCYQSRIQDNPLANSSPTNRHALLSVVAAAWDFNIPMSKERQELLDGCFSKLIQEIPHKNKQVYSKLVIKTVEAAVDAGMRDGLTHLLSHFSPSPPESIHGSYSSGDPPDVVNIFLRYQTLLAQLEGRTLTPRDESLLPALVKRKPSSKELTAQEKEYYKRENEREEENRKEITAFYEVVLPSYQLRSRAICNALSRKEFLEELHRALKSSASTSYAHRHRKPNWSSYRERLLCQTIVWSSADVEADLKILLESIKKPWPKKLLDLTEFTVRRKSLNMLSLELIKKAHDQTKNEKIQGEEKTQIMIRCAMLASIADDHAGQQYFDSAMAAAGEIDDEAFAKIDLISSIAIKCREDMPAACLENEAERFACVAEDFGVRLEGWEHFPWSKVISAVTHLSPLIGSAIACRWDQSGLRSIESSIPPLIESLIKTDAVDPRLGIAACALTNHEEEKAFDLSLKSVTAIEESANKDAQRAIEELVDFATRKCEFHARSKRSHTLVEWLNGRGRVCDDATRPVYRLVEFLDKSEADDDPKWYSSPMNSSDRAKSAESIIEKIEIVGRFVSHESIEKPLYELARLKNQEDIVVYDGNKTILDEIIDLVTPDDAALFLESLLNVSEDALSYWDLVEALTKCLEKWAAIPSVQTLIKSMPCLIAKRFIFHFVNSDGCSFYPVEGLFPKLGIDRTAFAAQVLKALCEEVERPQLSPRGLYELCKHAVPLLAVDDAKDCLSHLLEKALSQQDDFGIAAEVARDWKQVGDRSVESGLIWYLMGHPSTQLRWRAIHAARTLVRIGHTSLLDDIFCWLGDDKKHTYCMQDKAFYWLAARQWFFMLIEKIAHENPELLIPYRQQVLDELRSAPYPHAIVLACCQRTIEAISKTSLDAITPSELATARSVLSGTLAEPVDEWSYHSWSNDADEEDQNRGFKYDKWDTEEYWFQPLAAVFDLNKQDFLSYINQLVCNEWLFCSRIEEMDCTPKMYPQDSYSLTSNRHGSLPQVETFRTYLEIQSMLCGAVRMLKKHPIQLHRWDEESDKWKEWLKGWDLTSPGYWISDIRQTAPLLKNFWLRPDEDDDWMIAPTEKEYKDELGIDSELHEDSLVIWGNNQRSHYGSRRSTNIYSALVEPTTASSLMIALQNSYPANYRIPWEGDEEMEFCQEFEGMKFDLQGWVRNDQISKADLEESDPFSYRMPVDCPCLGSTASNYLKIDSDCFKTIFCNQETEELVAFRETWYDAPAYVQSESQAFITYGNRLWINRIKLLEFLKHKKKSLIIEVDISRSVEDGELIDPADTPYKDNRYDRQSRIFILDQLGKLSSIRGSYQTGKANCDRA